MRFFASPRLALILWWSALVLGLSLGSFAGAEDSSRAEAHRKSVLVLDAAEEALDGQMRIGSSGPHGASLAQVGVKIGERVEDGLWLKNVVQTALGNLEPSIGLLDLPARVVAQRVSQRLSPLAGFPIANADQHGEQTILELKVQSKLCRLVDENAQDSPRKQALTQRLHAAMATSLIEIARQLEGLRTYAGGGGLRQDLLDQLATSFSPQEWVAVLISVRSPLESRRLSSLQAQEIETTLDAVLQTMRKWHGARYTPSGKGVRLVNLIWTLGQSTLVVPLTASNVLYGLARRAEHGERNPAWVRDLGKVTAAVLYTPVKQTNRLAVVAREGARGYEQSLARDLERRYPLWSSSAASAHGRSWWDRVQAKYREAATARGYLDMPPTPCRALEDLD